MSTHVVMIVHFESSSALPTEVLMAESDATIKLHKEKVQQLLSENQTLRSQLALPAPVKTEASFSKTNILIQCCVMFYYRVCSYVKLCHFYYPVRMCKRGRVIALSVEIFVCLFVDTKMSTLREIGPQSSSTCNVRVGNVKY